MIVFWIFAIAMVIIAFVFLIRPLGLKAKGNDVDRTAQNVGITKERINDMRLELEQGFIDQAEFDIAREELEQSLLNDVEQTPSENTLKESLPAKDRVTLFALMFFIPALSISLYLFLGSQELITGKSVQASLPSDHPSTTGDSKLPSVEDLLDKLVAKLKENPDNAEGWFMLGRSYMSLKRYDDAVIALEKTNALVPNNDVILLRYADALTMSRGGKFSGKPFELIKQAVAIKPDNPTGLWLLGMGYEEQGEYAKSISYWNLLLPLLKDEKSIVEVKGFIVQAKIKLGVSVDENIPTSAKSDITKSFASLKVKVSLDKKFLEDIALDDTVFIFAKAVNGPPMPLAVVRKRVEDLPLEVVLDDNMAMIPTMKLSSFNEVFISARISKSGNPIAQLGDLYSKKKKIKLPFSDSINIKINLITE